MTAARSSTSCAVCRQRSTSALCGLGASVRARIDRDKATQRFRRGQLLLAAGSPVSALYIIRSGRVKVFRTERNGAEQVIRLLGPGEVLGFRPILADEPAAASAEAVEDTTACIVPVDTVREMLRDVPDLGRMLLGKLARELRASEDLMMDLLHRPVRQRAARLLLKLGEDNRGAPEPDVLYSRHLQRQDMARMIGTTPESLSRVLRSFAQQGTVAVGRDRLRILNRARLQRITQEGSPR